MPRNGRFTKPTLPEKTCAVCGRPFAWRKKWKRVWEAVRYCSERCRRQRGVASPNPSTRNREGEDGRKGA
ncbi:MAG: DUF2256 domain-containing protein [Opitutales bacterium]|nr:DUF2256 domain-containing protein [Opitutales bacterium]